MRSLHYSDRRFWRVLRTAAIAALAVSLTIPCLPQTTGNAGTSSGPSTAEVARSAFDFYQGIGVNVHLNYFDREYGDFALVRRELKRLGIKHLRDGAHLQSDDYNRMLYSRWIQLRELGMRFDVVLDPRSQLGPINAARLTQLDSLAKGSIETFEGPNELDISGLKDWTSVERDFQQKLYESATEMPARKQVIGPSLAAAANATKIGDLSAFLDYGNLHPYPAGMPPSLIFPEQIDLARELSNDKPVVVTETGYHNALKDRHDQPGISEEAAAKYIPRIFLENFAHGISRTYLYELMDEAPEPELTDLQMHWGLLRSDGTEKPAFRALVNLIALVKDDAEPRNLEQLNYTLLASSEPIHHLLLQKSNGDFLLILWQPAVSYDLRQQVDIQNEPTRATLELDKPFRKIDLYEPTMQAFELRSLSSIRKIDLQIPDHPLVIAIHP